jgi:MOSC domain-containing protein YiiM
MELSDEALPHWTKLAIGDAVIQITDQPHNGCAKFHRRFGADALKFVNSPVGKELHLRGVNARVLQNGTIRPGDEIRFL